MPAQQNLRNLLCRQWTNKKEQKYRVEPKQRRALIILILNASEYGFLLQRFVQMEKRTQLVWMREKQNLKFLAKKMMANRNGYTCGLQLETGSAEKRKSGKKSNDNFIDHLKRNKIRSEMLSCFMWCIFYVVFIPCIIKRSHILCARFVEIQIKSQNVNE